VCLTYVGGHSFSHSMNTHESNMRFHLFDGFIDSFSYGLGRVREHAYRASLLVHDFALVMLLLVLLMLFPLEIFVVFLMIASFFYLSQYFSMFLRALTLMIS
jgi:hypothetical protein